MSKKAEKKAPRTKQPKEKTVLVPERELKGIFDYALERVREISKKYTINKSLL